MKTLIVLLSLLICTNSAMGQRQTKADSLHQVLLQLQEEKQRIDDERKKIELQISKVEDQIQILAEQKAYKDGKLWVKCKGGWLISKPSPTDGDMIVQVPTGASIALSPDYYFDGYLKASYVNHEGYIYNRVLHGSPELDAMVARLAKNPATKPASTQQNSLYNSNSERRTTTKSYSRTYYTGPRGGCYYLSGSGKKVYVDRSLCN